MHLVGLKNSVEATVEGAEQMRGRVAEGLADR